MNFADISHHQSTVNLAAYKAAGHTRIFLKATEGTGFTDLTFKARWQEAGRLGLARVAYCYAEAQDNGADDFDHLLSVVNAAGGLGPKDRLCLDVEDVDDGNADYVRAQFHVREFTARAVARGVTSGLIYTGRWYANPSHVDPTDCAPGWRQLWISDYNGSIPDGSILLPAGWTRSQVVARQFTDRAAVSGVVGWCDYSRLLKDWLSPTPVPAVPAPTVPIQEDSDMRLIARENDFNTVLLLGNGTRRAVSDNGLVNAYRAAGVPYVKLPADQFALLVDATPAA